MKSQPTKYLSVKSDEYQDEWEKSLNHLKCLPIFHPMNVAAEDRLTNFNEAQRSNRQMIHVTFCAPEEIIIYDYASWYDSYSQYKDYYDKLPEQIKDYIKNNLDGKRCLVPEWIVWMVNTKEYVVSYISLFNYLCD